MNTILDHYPYIEQYLHLSSDVIIASDFREKRNNIEYWGLSFVLADLDSVQSFLYHNKTTRKEHKRVGQEINYKKLNPKSFSRVTHLSYLNSANTINGVLFNFVVHPSYDSISKDSYKNWSKASESNTFKFNEFQKLELLSHLVALIVSEIRSEIKSLKWVPDNDNLLNNSSRKTLAIQYFFEIISLYTNKNDFEYHLIDPDLDNEDLILADLSNIPDVIVGPMVDIQNAYLEKGIDITDSVVPIPNEIKDKSVEFSEWFFDNEHNLKKINLEISYDNKKDKIIFSKLFPSS